MKHTDVFFAVPKSVRGRIELYVLITLLMGLALRAQNIHLSERLRWTWSSLRKSLLERAITPVPILTRLQQEQWPPIS